MRDEFVTSCVMIRLMMASIIACPVDEAPSAPPRNPYVSVACIFSARKVSFVMMLPGVTAATTLDTLPISIYKVNSANLERLLEPLA